MISAAPREMAKLLIGISFVCVSACARSPSTARIQAASTRQAETTESWVRVAPSDSATNCFALKVAPGVAGVLYAGCRPQGFLVSRDNGRNWVSQSRGLPGLDVTSWEKMIHAKTGPAFNAKGITIDPGNPQTIYAALEWSGVFKSTDGGGTWQQRATGLEPGYGHNAIRLVVDPSNPSVLYVGTDGGIHKSVDGGLSWRYLTTGLPRKIKTSTTVFGLVIDPARTSTVYAAFYTAGDTGTSGVYKSVDAGATWSPANNGLPTGRRSPPFQRLEHRSSVNLVMDPVDPATLYVVTTGSGVYKSVDGATHWSPLPATDSLGMALALMIDPRDRRTLYLGVHRASSGSRSGVYMSQDAGASWRWIGLPGPPNGLFNDFVIDARGDGALYAAVSSGIYKLPDPRRLPQASAVRMFDKSGTRRAIFAGTRANQ